jgi:hypothetical protein
MSKIAALFAVLMLALPASAFAQDYRSPDAEPIVIAQDFRSPDAHPATVNRDFRSPDARSSSPTDSGQPVSGRPGYVSVGDLRSPDAGPAGVFQPSVPAETANSFNWGYLALGITAALILLAVAFVLTQRRRRHGLAIGH